MRPRERGPSVDLQPGRRGQRGADPVERLAYLAALGGAFAVPLGQVRIASFALSDILFAASAVCFLVSSGLRPTPSKVFQSVFWLGAVTILAASISAVSTSESLLAGMRLLYVWTIWQWGLRGTVSSRQRLQGIAIAFVIGAGLSGLVGVLQVYSGLNLPGVELTHGRSAGLQGHPNGQGGVLAAALPLSLMLALQRPTLLVGLWGVATATVGLIASGSVSGMIGAGAGIVMALFVRRTSIQTIMVTGCVVAATAYVVVNLDKMVPGAVSPLTRIADSTGYGQGVGTFASRLDTINYAVEQALASPLVGVGLDPASGATENGQTLTHNVLVLMWYQGGALLAVATLLLLVSFLSRGIRLAHQTQDVLLVGIAVAGMAVTVVAMSGPVLYDRWFWFPVLLCAAVCTTRARTTQETEA